MMQTILVTGGTGTIGTVLTRMLIDSGHRVIILSRNAPPTGRLSVPEPPAPNAPDATSPAARPGLQRLHWDPATGFIDPEAIRQADFIVHLAGAGVADHRWTAKRKKVIEESRTKTAGLLVKAIRETPNNIKAVLSASGIGWYGPDPTIPNPRPFEEPDPADSDFLGETCRPWE